MMGRIQEFCVNAPKLQNRRFFSENAYVLAKGYRHTCSASPTKKMTWRGRGAGVKNKIQGAGPFFDWILADNLQRLAHRKKVASPGQSSTDRTWWDEFKNFVSTRPNCKTGVLFFPKMHLSLQKGTDTHVQLHQPKKVTSRGRGARVKNKIQGAGPFLTEYLWMIFKGWPHRKKIASPGQPSIDRKWWDKFQRVAKLQNRSFYLKIHLSMQKGCALPWASAGPHPWSRGLWKTASCQPGSQVPGIHFFLNSFFPVSVWGGEIWHVTNASIQEIFFLLGYQRGKFIGCWTLGTWKLAKKIQKGGWKWDFGFRG